MTVAWLSRWPWPSMGLPCRTLTGCVLPAPSPSIACKASPRSKVLLISLNSIGCSGVPGQKNNNNQWFMKNLCQQFAFRDFEQWRVQAHSQLLLGYIQLRISAVFSFLLEESHLALVGCSRSAQNGHSPTVLALRRSNRGAAIHASRSISGR